MPKEWKNIGRREMDGLESHEEFQTARDLLTKDLVLQTSTGPKRLRITQVEPFTDMVAESHLESFCTKERSPGELFVIWHRGFPFLNVVVNPTEGKIVCIRRALLDGKEVTAARIIAELGFGRSNYAAGKIGTDTYKDAVMATLDGEQLMRTRRESLISIQNPRKPDGSVVELRKHFGDRARNSLGLFGDCAKIPDAEV